MSRILALLLLLPTLVACASLDELKRVEPKGSQFAIALAEQYKEFSQSEADQYDWADSQYFAEKGLKAAYGQPMEPEEIEHWDLPRDLVPTFKDARKQLMEALNEKVAAEKPALAAKVVFSFDCWVEQQEENWQADDINSCRDEFYETLNMLIKPVEDPKAPTAITPVEEKNGFTPTPNPAEQIATSYVVFFDLNSTKVTKEGESVLDDVFNELSDDTEYTIHLDGYADRSGSDKYNIKLSEMRSAAVKNRLVQKGLNKGKIILKAHGEETPLIETPDGAKEKANRRVEIFINE